MWVLEGSVSTENPTKKDIARELHALTEGTIDVVMLSRGGDFLQAVEVPGRERRLSLEYHPQAGEGGKTVEYFRLRASVALARAQEVFEHVLDRGRPLLGQEWDKISEAKDAGRGSGSVAGIVILFVVLGCVLVGGGAYAAQASHAPAWEGALAGGLALLVIVVDGWLATHFFARWIPSLGQAVGRALGVPVVIGGRYLAVWPRDRGVRAPGKLFLVRLVVFVSLMMAGAVLLGVLSLFVGVWSLLQR